MVKPEARQIRKDEQKDAHLARCRGQIVTTGKYIIKKNFSRHKH